MGENNVSHYLHKTVANESFWEIKLTIEPSMLAAYSLYGQTSQRWHKLINK